MKHYCRYCKTLLSEHENSNTIECSYCDRMFAEIQREQGLQSERIDPYPYEPCGNCGKYPDRSVSHETSL